jgi:hypothetical protein
MSDSSRKNKGRGNKDRTLFSDNGDDSPDVNNFMKSTSDLQITADKMGDKSALFDNDRDISAISKKHGTNNRR